MPKTLLRLFALCVLSALYINAQFPGFQAPQGERIDSDTAVHRALEKSSLTEDGTPFHAVMEIGTAGTPYTGHLELWWVSPDKYRLQLTSPELSQTKIVNGSETQETDQGDYYPRWLENFVLALMDPIPIQANFVGRNGSVLVGEQITDSCLRRDDRPKGITDNLTWGILCFSGSAPHVQRVLATNLNIEYADWRKFGKKEIAREYSTDVLDYKPVKGHLTILESLKQPDESMFAVTKSTPAKEQIQTRFVSTLTEESMLEKAPELHWPDVHEGKTDGYMIVYARTDRTGQVRESSKHNSDNAELEQYGMEQALNYKFRPLLVDGVPQQMEMPLVLHFTARIGNPLPILTAEQMQKQIVSCDIKPLRRGILPSGLVFAVTLQINETGKIDDIRPRDSAKGIGLAFASVIPQLQNCVFAPYTLNGKVTAYKGDLEFIAP